MALTKPSLKLIKEWIASGLQVGTHLLVTGNVGINTSTPKRTLDVVGDVRITEGSIFSNAGWMGLYTDSYQALPVKVNSLTTSLDYGKSAPDGGLYVGGESTFEGRIKVRSNRTLLDALAFDGGAATGNHWITLAAGTEPTNLFMGFTRHATDATRAGLLTFGNNTAVVDITNGRVGIGTVTPSYTLHVVGELAVGGTGKDLMFTNEAGAAVLRVKNYGVDSLTAINIGNDAVDWQIRVEGSNADALSISSATSGVYYMTFAGGRVGIGTTSPTQALHVVGSMRAGGYYLNGSDNSEMRVLGGAAAAPSQHIHFLSDYTKQVGSTDVQVFFGYSSEVRKFSFLSRWSGTNRELFGINAETNVVSLDSSFGVGTGSPIAKVHIAGDNAIALAIQKSAVAVVAPGPGVAAFRVEAGTNAGTLKIVAYAGTSTAGVTVADNIGAGN